MPSHATGFVCAGCSVPLVKKSTGRNPKWCSEKCRKASACDPCVDCGARTSYGAATGRIPEPRCRSCATEHFRIWRKDRVLSRIREWAATYGEPPSMGDWNPYHAGVVLGDIERAARFRERAGHWPTFTTVVREFGSWNDAVVVAGFTPRVAHGGGGNERRRRGLLKTHCIHGHEFSPENTYVLPGSGKRICRQCQRDRRARWLANRDAVAA